MNDIRRMLVSEFFQSADEHAWLRRIRYVVLMGIILRLAMVFGVVGGMQQMGDGPAYVRQATELLSGTVDHFYFPPGTALFTLPVFAVFGVTPFSEHLAGVLISIAFLGGVVWLAQTVLTSKRAVFLAAALASIYPHVVLSAAQISSLPLTAALVCVAIAACVRGQRDSRSWWIVSACASAMAILVRPGTALLPVVLGLWGMVVAYRSGQPLMRLLGVPGILLSCTAMFCVPVMVFHAARGHGWTLATNAEWNLLLANNPYAPDYKTGHFGQRAIADLSPDAQAFIRQFFSTETAEPASLEQRTRMADSAKAYIISHPARTLWRISNRARGFFGCDYTAAREMQLVFGYSDAMFGLLMAFEGGVFILVFIGWLFFLLGYAPGGMLPKYAHVGVMLAIIAPHLAAFALAKYHLPVVPIMICGAAACIDGVIGRDRNLLGRLEKRRMWLMSMVVAVFVVQVEHLYQLILLR
ncbi:MAG: hypothetical protein FGM32_05960 [Candidatus Kapabacteria bacterium]|nr:hypothetical protein [Candidatus Kapabacteria bacterium]